MNCNMIVVKLWNSSKALRHCCYKLMDMTVKLMDNDLQKTNQCIWKKSQSESFFRALESCNMQIRLRVSFSCIIGLKSRKSVWWSVVLVPCPSRLWLKLRMGAGQRPQRAWWPVLSLIWRMFSSFQPLGFGFLGWDFGGKAGFGPLRLNLGLQGWNLVLKTGIWALRMGSGPGYWDSDHETMI